MVKADRQDDERKVADEAASFSNLADASARLFAEQAAAMAVFTAYGMSVATQMTGMMLGALRGPADAMETNETELPPKVDAGDKVVRLRPVEKVKPHTSVKAPAAKAPTRKPAISKPATGKPEARAAAGKVSPAKPETSVSGDDLKQIPGIGPRLEKVLRDRGILRFSDLSGLSKAALKKLDGELGLEGRVIRDDWAGQAKALSGGKG